MGLKKRKTHYCFGQVDRGKSLLSHGGKEMGAWETTMRREKIILGGHIFKDYFYVCVLPA